MVADLFVDCSEQRQFTEPQYRSDTLAATACHRYTARHFHSPHLS